MKVIIILVNLLYFQSYAQTFRQSLDLNLALNHGGFVFEEKCLDQYKNIPIKLPPDILNEIETNQSIDSKTPYWYLYHWTNDINLYKKFSKKNIGKLEQKKIVQDFIHSKKFLVENDLSFPSIYASNDFITSSGYGKILLKLKIQVPKKILYKNYQFMISWDRKNELNNLNSNICEKKDPLLFSNLDKMIWLLGFEDAGIDIYFYPADKNEFKEILYGYSQLINPEIIEDFDVIDFKQRGSNFIDNTFQKNLLSLTNDEMIYYLYMPTTHFNSLFNNNFILGKPHIKTAALKNKVKHLLNALETDSLGSMCQELKKYLNDPQTIPKQFNSIVEEKGHWFCLNLLNLF